ncbi:phosphatidylinositol-glycan biosynthesis class F protein-like [Apostichopus japonicus]|uniref:phosphatidylinositol-glycan biosynthesis class F protein-like n=1 Tax=Stichopus japonicus TaxID=307972 RepID=UPI003AB46EAB
MASNRGDLLEVSKQSLLRLLYMNILLLVSLFVLNFLLLVVEWRFNIVTHTKDAVKLAVVAVTLVESVCFLFCGSFTTSTNTYSTKLKFRDHIYNLLKAVIIFLSSCVLLHVITVLYGAPAFENVEQTFLFSLLLTTLSIVPCLLFIGTDFESWTRLYFERRPENAAELCLLYIVVCSYVGAWLGAFPIPLDWERPWQEWPITVCIGALVGHTAGILLSICHLLYHMTEGNKPQFR